MLIEAVDEAMHKSLQSIHEAMEAQTQRITETETRIASVEEDNLDIHTQNTDNEDTIGITETYNATAIMRLCTTGIPEALGLHNPMPVERAHRLGPFKHERNCLLRGVRC